MLVQDLTRPDSVATADALVDRYADGEPELLRRDYFQSLLAAFTIDEIRAQLDTVGFRTSPSTRSATVTSSSAVASGDAWSVRRETEVMLWLFCYDYVVAPGVGRLWPSPATYGSRYVYGATIAAFAVVAGAVAAGAAVAAALGERQRRRALAIVVAGAIALAVAWSAWLVDDFLVALSPHWSQKAVIARYYRLRGGPEEPLIAWNLYWRGENFYTRNEISSAADPMERTEWAYIDVPARLHAYLPTHRGRRLFFLVEPSALPALKSALGPALAATLAIVDTSNCKVDLVTIEN